MTVTLEVEHITTYRYSKPVRFGEHRVAFHPRTAHDIRVLSSSLEVSPESEQRWIHDVFSNSLTIVKPLVPAQALVFTARFAIEHDGIQNEALPIDPDAKFYPFEYSAEDKYDLSNFLPLQYPADAAMVREWSSSFLPARGRTHTRDILSNINAAIRSDFIYAARDAMGTQSPGTTLQMRSGTCRDFALLMIEAVRGLGLAARFVSGYIYDASLDDAQATDFRDFQSRDSGGMVGSGATHAWLHVFLPGAGWVPFDPTNTLSGGTDLIRVAFTRTPEQAAPVVGSWSGDAGDFLGMSVSVNVRRVDPRTPALATSG